MITTKNYILIGCLTAVTPFSILAETGQDDAQSQVSDSVIAQQRAELATNTKGKGFGPQSPRDIDMASGMNVVHFSAAPSYQDMNLCNIHFHKNAEHKGGQFTTYAGNGDGKGFQTGFVYDGKLSDDEKHAPAEKICPSDHGGLNAGDTIEVHYVYSTANIKPGPTLGACLSESINNPQLRVEAQVYVLVNDPYALDFNYLVRTGKKMGNYQAINLPNHTGDPVQYSGSTTGPNYNEKGSPFQVTWSVRPNVAKVNIETVGKWCKGNEFKEDHAHGVRNLITNSELLSPIQR